MEYAASSIFGELKPEFEEKARHKGHQADSFIPTWQRKTKQFENLWNPYLAHQIADLPKFEGVCRALNWHFKGFEVQVS